MLKFPLRYLMHSGEDLCFRSFARTFTSCGIFLLVPLFSQAQASSFSVGTANATPGHKSTGYLEVPRWRTHPRFCFVGIATQSNTSEYAKSRGCRQYCSIHRYKEDHCGYNLSGAYGNAEVVRRQDGMLLAILCLRFAILQDANANNSLRQLRDLNIVIL